MQAKARARRTSIFASRLRSSAAGPPKGARADAAVAVTSARAAGRVALFAAATASCHLVAGVDDPLPGPASLATTTADGGVSGGDGAVATGSGYAKEVLADGPRLYLRFSETSGVRAKNLGSAGGDLVLSGNAARGRPSLVGDSDPSVGLGDGAQLTLDASYDYPLARPFTYEIWVRPAAYGDVIGNQVNKPDLFGTALYFNSTTFPYIGFERWGGTIIRFAHSENRTVPSLGEVFHLVVVNAADKPTLYVNGARFDGYATGSAALPAPAPLTLGTLKGDFDEIAVYEKALTADRVLAHYGAGKK